ncbi:MAG: Fe(3+) ABC transporter substrate-binding protein [Rhizobiales bacterium]|nr:Fe(3+) ABC transporter substrate-binding protein [Hyphomicrobiales bacterium]
MFRTLAFSFLALCSAALATSDASAEGVVNVYSYRQPQLVEPLFKAFQDKTGIEVKMVFAEKGLIERMEQEGELSPVDVLLTADVGRLVEAADKGLAQAVTSDLISGKVPAALRDPANQWFGLTMRARVVYASRERVKQDAISYEELADPKWKGKLCTRPGDHPYNLGLVAAMIAERGEAATKTWLEGVKANLAVKPNGNDRSQARSVAAGECDLAIANTYYMGLMMTNEKEPEQKDWAAASRIIFPSSPEMGTHVNISGMLMAKHAPDRENALKLMEFLASDESQALYASQNFEYPVNQSIKPSDIVAGWGSFMPGSVNLLDVARNQKAAAKLINEVHFND